MRKENAEEGTAGAGAGFDSAVTAAPVAAAAAAPFIKSNAEPRRPEAVGDELRDAEFDDGCDGGCDEGLEEDDALPFAAGAMRSLTAPIPACRRLTAWSMERTWLPLIWTSRSPT